MEFDGEFPIANLTFKDKDFPADVKMTAFNPFIPSDSKNSSIPAAFFEIEVNNTTDETLKYQIALSISNPFAPSLNKAEVKDGYRMLKLINSGADKGSTSYGDLTVATDCEKPTPKLIGTEAVGKTVSFLSGMTLTMWKI